jgi:hypothetical protein
VNDHDPPNSISEQLDRELVRAAVAKRAAGKPLSRQERSALKKFEADKERADRQRYYRTVPKKDYVALSGRLHKQLADCIGRYGVPLEGETVDLYRVLRWFHDFLAEHGPLVRRTAGIDPELAPGEGDSPALEKLREEKFRQARLERLEMERQLLPRATIHDGLTRLAARLRSCGEQLQRQHGSDALDVLNEALEDFQREVEALLAAPVDLYGEEMTKEAE